MCGHRDLFVERWARAPDPAAAAGRGGEEAAAAARGTRRGGARPDPGDRRPVPFTDRGSGDPRMAALLRELADSLARGADHLRGRDGRKPTATPSRCCARGSRSSARRSTGSAGSRSGASTTARDRQPPRRTSTLQRLPRADPAAGAAVFDTEAFTFRRLERARRAPRRGRGAGAAARSRPQRRARPRSAPSRRRTSSSASRTEEAELIAEIAPGKPAFVLPESSRRSPTRPASTSASDLVFFGGFLAGAASPNDGRARYLVERGAAALLGAASRRRPERDRRRHRRPPSGRSTGRACASSATSRTRPAGSRGPACT